jgi:hypothetical protein
MAHFEDDHHHRISGETLPIRVGHIKTVYLWGGDFNGGNLYVSTSNPTALQITEQPEHRPNYRKFVIRALQDAGTEQIRASTDQNGTCAWDVFDLVVLTAAESGQYYRDRVMGLAGANIGAHYLWGACGAAPDVANGMPGRPGSVSMWTRSVEGDDIMTSAAICRVSGDNTCAGRPWIYGHRNVPPFIQRASELDHSNENDRYSYRTVRTAYRSVRKPGIILGERCEGKRHFDCVGFVNYCLSMALGEGTQLAICGDEAHGYRGYANTMIRLSPTDPHRPGDILIFGGSEIDFEGRRVAAGSHHIAFSVGDGANMIHAAETEYGVVRSAIGQDLLRRVRHPRLA